MRKVYLDYAATSPLDPKVLEEMLPYLKENFGNPSSIHSSGQEARVAVDKAREIAARFLNCSPEEIFFIGSATEADNIAILGVVKAALRQGSGQAQKKGVAKPHIITSAIEHPAVLETCRYLEKQGIAEVNYLPVNKEGVVKVEDLEKAIKPNTALVSIMYANNEIGTVQPIAEIAAVIHKSKIINHKSSILFHTDAAQAVNYLNCDVEKLGIDLLTLSGHKIYGPKGIGVLYVKKGTLIEPIMYGGHQEQGIRPGTEAVANIVGFGEAVKGIVSQKSKIANLKKLRDKLLQGILNKIPKTYLNGSLEQRLPNNINISFAGVEGESILMALDQKGIAVSTGSACASGSLEPSHVLMALGLSSERAHGSIRFSLGRYTTEQEIDYVLQVLPKVVERLREISGYR